MWIAVLAAMFGKKKSDQVEEVREFDVDSLERDEDGNVILPDDITYTEFLHFTHPEFTEAELRRKIAKENVSVWLVRFIIAAFVALAVLIFVLHMTS